MFMSDAFLSYVQTYRPSDASVPHAQSCIHVNFQASKTQSKSYLCVWIFLKQLGTILKNVSVASKNCNFDIWWNLLVCLSDVSKLASLVDSKINPNHLLVVSGCTKTSLILGLPIETLSNASEAGRLHQNVWADGLRTSAHSGSNDDLPDCFSELLFCSIGSIGAFHRNMAFERYFIHHWISYACIDDLKILDFLKVSPMPPSSWLLGLVLVGSGIAVGVFCVILVPLCVC